MIFFWRNRVLLRLKRPYNSFLVMFHQFFDRISCKSIVMIFGTSTNYSILSEKTSETSSKIGYSDVLDIGEHDSAKKNRIWKKKFFFIFWPPRGLRGGTG